jgi:hypothetical protein
VFEALFADVIGESHLPLAQRFKTKLLTGEKPTEPHKVSYYATREEYVGYLRPIQGAEIEKSLGLYLPPKKGPARRGHAYFFRDQDGELAVSATLYHEVSHQLLFESGVANPSSYKNNYGNYWVFEGIGTYFETLTLNPDGTVRIGGRVGPRIEEARKNLVENGRMTPLSAFVKYDKSSFLMLAGEGAYRESFLDYVKDACQGKIKGLSGRSLEDRLETPYATLESELVAYLKGTGVEK